MNKVTLYVSDCERFDEPDDEHCGIALTEYDPNDPESLQSAREALRRRFSLSYLPVLCNEPEPGFFSKLFRNWFGNQPTMTPIDAAMDC